MTILNTDYVVADQDNDGFHTKDLWIITPSGSYGYEGLTTGGFIPNVWTRSDLAFREFVVH